MKPKSQNLYEPIHYILDLGGKMRPVLTLMSAEVLMIIKALPAALGVEVFHTHWYMMILWMMLPAKRTRNGA
jgi:geranylgeranyl pyrophosphate synthase